MRPEQQLNRKMADQAQVVAECEQLEGAIAELRAAYEQYFLGLEKRPPVQQHAAIKRQLQHLKSMWVRQTAAKFRVQSVQQKFATYERLWSRTMQEIENGTYHRDVARIRRKSRDAQKDGAAAGAKRPSAREDFTIDEVSPDEIDALLSGAAFAEPPPPPPQAVPAAPPKAAAPSMTPVKPITPAVAPVIPPLASAKPQPVAAANAATLRPASSPAVGQAQPRVPVIAPPRAAAPVAPPTAGAGATLSDDKLRAVYDAYVKAKKRCNEDVSGMSYDQVANTLRRQVPELMKKHKAKAVEFKVVIKDGKAILRAVPKGS